MAMPKSLANALVDSALQSPPSRSSPLRRKSIILQKKGTTNILENDDEAERRARRRDSISAKGITNSLENDSGKRRSVNFLLTQLSEPEIAARVTQCIKLNAENKINIKNAFSLEIIDFMNYIVKNKDSNMNNLQVASTSLDVSTKIYGFRVDGVHNEILKMVGGLEKHAVADENGDGNVAATGVGQEVKLVKKKKKKNPQILSTAESLKGAVETVNIRSMMLNECDSQTTDMLCQVMLPLHYSSEFYLHQFNDILLDTIPANEMEKCISESEQKDISIPQIASINDAMICSSFDNFKFHDWSVDDEADDNNVSSDGERNDNDFQVDLDASLPRDDEAAPVSMTYFDIHNEDENQESCQRRVSTAENIVDLRQVVMASGQNKASEYSFIQKNMKMHWAGPSHWKLTNFHPNFLRGSVGETCRQVATRKRKEIELSYAQVLIAVNDKFLPSKAIRIQPKTARIDWHEEKLTLPEDIHYGMSQGCQLNLHPELSVKFSDEDEMNTTQVDEDGEVYDYNNDNDTSNYCPNVENDDYQGNDNNVDSDAEIRSDELGAGLSTAYTENNLIAAPKQVNKIAIKYSARPKKVDMKQLKQSIWKNLLVVQGDENIDGQQATVHENPDKIVGSKRFSEIYKELPKEMSKNNVEALSFPVAFVSLLHLANERSLNITNLDDFSDIIVRQD